MDVEEKESEKEKKMVRCFELEQGQFCLDALNLGEIENSAKITHNSSIASRDGGYRRVGD